MSAQRASAPVRFARLAAAALLIGLAAIVAARLAGRRGGPPSVPVPPPPADRVVDLQERVRQQEFKDGRAVADIRGETFFRGPDGRNHLKGSIEFASLGPAGEIQSRLSADEVVYDPGSLRFAVLGRVRVEAGGVVLEGDAFEYDKTAGLFETKSGGRFSSKTMTGNAPEIAYAEAADEVRLNGGFRVLIRDPERTDRSLAITGASLVYARPGRQGRIDGRGSVESPDFRAESAGASFVASPDGSSLESAVFEGAAMIAFAARRGTGGRGGEIRADRIAVEFLADLSALASIQASGRSSLIFRPAEDRVETILAPAARVRFDPADGAWAWSASGGVRAETTEAGRLRRTLEGDEAVFDPEGTLRVSGGPGRPAVADSAEARVEAPALLVVSDKEELSASGGVACVLKKGEEGRPAGFFSPREDVSVSSERLEVRSGNALFSFSGNVLARQAASVLRADEVEFAGDTGRMSGRGAVSVTVAGPAEGRAGSDTIELGGQDMAYRPDSRTLTLSSKAYVRLAEAGLQAGSVSAVLALEGRGIESLTAAKDVVVSKGRFEGRSEAGSYLAATDRITLTGRPVLTDGKGGSARGAKLTFDLADDKIFIDNEGSGRATTVVRS